MNEIRVSCTQYRHKKLPSYRLSSSVAFEFGVGDSWVRGGGGVE